MPQANWLLQRNRRNGRLRPSLAARVVFAVAGVIVLGCEPSDVAYRQLPRLDGRVFVAGQPGRSDLLDLTNTGQAPLSQLTYRYAGEPIHALPLAHAETKSIPSPERGARKTLMVYCNGYQFVSFDIEHTAAGNILVRPSDAADTLLQLGKQKIAGERRKTWITRGIWIVVVVGLAVWGGAVWRERHQDAKPAKFTPSITTSPDRSATPEEEG